MEGDRLVAEILYVILGSVTEERLNEALNPVTGGMTVYDAKDQRDNLAAFVKERHMMTGVRIKQVNHNSHEEGPETVSIHFEPLRHGGYPGGKNDKTFPGIFWFDIELGAFLLYCVIHIDEARKSLNSPDDDNYEP